MAYIDVLNLVKTFGKKEAKVTAVNRVSLSFEKGEFTVIAGPSGSGKTTLLNLIGGLDSPDEGKVIIDGTDIHSLKKKELARFRLFNIGFIFQSYNLIPVLTAFENAELVLVLQKVKKSVRKEKIMPLFEALGMRNLENRFPNELSGGQQQRVSVIRAIAPGPKVVLADEPTANLDSVASERLLEVMYKLNVEKGVTFIFSSHDPIVIKKAKRVVMLRDGRVVEDRIQ